MSLPESILDHSPQETTLDRYKSIVGHDEPLNDLNEVIKIIAALTNRPLYNISSYSRGLMLRLKLRTISPDVFMFLHDVKKDASQLQEKFHWKQGITIGQASLVLIGLTATSNNPSNIFSLNRQKYEQIRQSIKEDYPTVSTIFPPFEENNPKSGSIIPGRLFLNRLNPLLTTSELERLQQGIFQLKLSATEYAILCFIVRRMSYKEICGATGRKYGTIKTQIDQIIYKLDVNSKAKATRKAIQEGIMPPSFLESVLLFRMDQITWSERKKQIEKIRKQVEEKSLPDGIWPYIVTVALLAIEEGESLKTLHESFQKGEQKALEQIDATFEWLGLQLGSK